MFVISYLVYCIMKFVWSITFGVSISAMGVGGTTCRAEIVVFIKQLLLVCGVPVHLYHG